MCFYFLNLKCLSSLSEEKGSVADEVIRDFAVSDLPNTFFLQQFYEPYPKPFCEKKYWRSFARILVCRGIDKISDVKEDILIWFQDINWPGCDVIFPFVKEHITQFGEALTRSLERADREDDEVWYNSLKLVESLS